MARTKTTPRKYINYSATQKISCNICSKTFTRIANLKRHYNQKHNAIIKKYECSECYTTFGCLDIAKRHIGNIHPNMSVKIEQNDTTIFSEVELPTNWTPPLECLPKQKQRKLLPTTTPIFKITLGNSSLYTEDKKLHLYIKVEINKIPLAVTIEQLSEEEEITSYNSTK